MFKQINILISVLNIVFQLMAHYFRLIQKEKMAAEKEIKNATPKAMSHSKMAQNNASNVLLSQ